MVSRRVDESNGLLALFSPTPHLKHPILLYDILKTPCPFRLATLLFDSLELNVELWSNLGIR
jgi:hypothetical protein